jgi:hypothetical protein
MLFIHRARRVVVGWFLRRGIFWGKRDFGLLRRRFWFFRARNMLF